MTTETVIETGGEKKYSLPTVGEYELQIDSVSRAPNKFDGGEDLRVRFLLLGTKNPDFEDEPYLVTLFLKVTDWLGSSGTDKTFMSNYGTFLTMMGFTIPPYAKPEHVDESQLVGLYAKGMVTHNKAGTFPQLRAKALLPMTNEHHIKTNAVKAETLINKPPRK